MKQETLEEAAENYSWECSKIREPRFIALDAFIAGAKWQAKRMYSEKEVLELLIKSHFVEQNIEEWFEQFKKK